MESVKKDCGHVIRRGGREPVMDITELEIKGNIRRQRPKKRLMD